MLANPSNPVGCMFDAQAFGRLLDATPAGTLLVIDEAYYEYAQRTRGFPDALAALRAQRRPWIVLRTFSKAWGLAGLRVGYGIASDASLIQWLDRVRTPFNVNEAAQVAALAAWDDEIFMTQTVAETVKLRDALARQLRAMALPGLRIAPSAANFLFIDLGRPNGPVNEALLARGIIVKPWKEPGFENFIRVSIGTADDNARFLRALGEIVGQQDTGKTRHRGGMEGAFYNRRHEAHRLHPRAAAARHPRPTHRHPRRRDGHDDPALQARPRPTTAASASRTIPSDLKGNNELLLADPARRDPRHPRGLPRGRRRPDRDQHLRRDPHRAGRLRAGRSRARDEPRVARKLARAACDKFSTPDKPRFVAGALGPTPQDREHQPRRERPRRAQRRASSELRAAYYEQAEALVEGGCRPVPGRDHLRHAQRQGRDLRARRVCSRTSGERLPVIISGTVTDASGRILSGQTVTAFWHSVRHARPLAIGLNCALGAALMRPYIEELAQVAGDTFISCYPNAGLPNPMSETGFDETPDVTSRLLRRVRRARAW